MNERIRELFEKHTVPNFGADADTVRNQKGEYRTPMIEDHWQTFQEAAELIVRECMSMCITAVGNADYNTGRMHCYNNIKEHFGVK